MTPEQQAYEKWLEAYTGGHLSNAITHGYHTWENLPEKVKEAWKVTVEFIVEEWESGRVRR